MTDLVEEVEALLRKTEEIWDTQDYAKLKELWDTDDPDPFYLAEEEDDWRVGWPALESYWAPVPGRRMVEALLMRFRDVQAKMIGPDLALAAYWVHHDMKMSGPIPAWGGDARVMAILRKKPEGWRYVAYMEGPMSPIKYVQRLYEKSLSPEFSDFHEEIMERDGHLFEARNRKTGNPKD